MTDESSLILSFAIEELSEHSALFGAGPCEQVWLPDTADEGWYSHHVNRVVSERTGRRLGPRFKCQQTPDGLATYECFVGLGRGPWRAIVNSGVQNSTLAAMNAVIEKVSQIPIDSETNWNEQLAVLLPYKGTRTPVFKNEVAIGMPAIRCTLVWGVGAELRTVRSGAFYTRELAFNDAVQRALNIGPVEVPTPVAIPIKPNWSRIVRRQVKEVPRHYNLIVRFHILKSSGRFRCQIIWGKDSTASVESLPMTEQQAAFDDAVRLLKQRFVVTTRTPPTVYVECKDEPNISAAELLAIAMQRWTVERNHLFQRKEPNHDEIVRLNVLSSFLVILDPLRCYELDKMRRIEAIRQLRSELSDIWTSLSAESKHSRRIRSLRLLLGSAFKESGAPLQITPKVENELQRQGYEVSETIRDLLKVRYVRKFSDGSHTLSPIGSTALEAALTVGTEPGTVVRALPATMVAFLFDLMARLSDQTICGGK